jgi:16S rRNA (uracil1498-N3)-methyltransferase
MHRFFVPPAVLAGDQVVLEGDVLHHLGTVLRLRPGTEILLLDGTGAVVRCRIQALGRHLGSAQVLERWQESDPAFPVCILQSLPKGDKFDLVLQKGTELGVFAFVPLLTGRSIPTRLAQKEEQRLTRWRRIIGEAARQCGRPRLPGIVAPKTLEEALADCREDLRLLLWEEETRPLAAVLPRQPPRSAAILIGPEGGFSPTEARQAQAAGFRSVRLGSRILRSETAGFTVAAILQYVYGDLGPMPGAVPPPAPETREECL